MASTALGEVAVEVGGEAVGTEVAEVFVESRITVAELFEGIDFEMGCEGGEVTGELEWGGV